MRLTLQRVSRQAQLADDVAWDVGLHQVTFFGVIFSRLQQMIKLLRVKLLHTYQSHIYYCCYLVVVVFVTVYK